MEGMKTNYRTATEMEEELRNNDLSNFLEFDDDGRYDFARCESCYGPLLGHLEVKCKGEGIRYGSGAVTSFKI